MSFQFQPKRPKNALQEYLAAQSTALVKQGSSADTNANTNAGSTIVRPFRAEFEAKGYIAPEKAKEKIRIIFDDSDSMDGAKIKDAKQGCIKYLQICTVNQVAIAIHPLNLAALPLETNLPYQAALIEHIKTDGATPLYRTISEALAAPEGSTRLIVFSDGSPTDTEEETNYPIAKAIEKKIPIDTVYLQEPVDTSYGPAYSSRAQERSKKEKDLLQLIANRTGGIFLVFDRSKVNFSHAFKYLAPSKRHLLLSASFKADVEAGRI